MFSIILLWLLIILLIHTLFKLINIKKNYLICFLISILIVLFFTNLNLSMKAAIDGCNLWFKAMVPTLFPFLVICNLLISYEGISLYSKILGPILCKPLGLSKVCSFPLTASFLCGYPLGAKYCTDIYDLGYIEKKEYFRLLNIASNCVPLFLIGSVGAAMLGNAKFGYILLVGNYLSLILIGLITRRKNTHLSNKSSNSLIKSSNHINFGQALKNAVDNAISVTIQVGGFIVIFSVIIGIIKNNATISIIFHNLESFLSIPKDSLYALFLGSIEITNGCNIICNSTLTIPLKLSIISFLCSFSGLSIIAQVSSFISKHNTPMPKYISLKFIQGVLSFIITFIIANLFAGSIPTSSITPQINSNINIIMYIIPCLIILCIYLISKLFNKLSLHIS